MVDWRKEAINDLKQYQNKVNALSSIASQIEALEELILVVRPANTSSDPVTGGSSRNEDRLINNIAKRERLEHNYHATDLLVKEMDKALSLLSDRDREILTAYYINGEHEIEVMQKVGLERSQFYDSKRKALYNYTVAFYGTIDL